MERSRPAPVAETGTAVTPQRLATPFPVANGQTTGFAETLTEGSLAKQATAVVEIAPERLPAAVAPPAAGAISVASVRNAVVQALAAAGHSSASQLLGAGVWTLDGASLRIEVAAMGKKMLSLTVNAAAEKIIRQQLQQLGAPTRFLVAPGTGESAGQALAAAPLAGSVQEAALANPLVQRAKEIFQAEVRSVVDLRKK